MCLTNTTISAEIAAAEIVVFVKHNLSFNYVSIHEISPMIYFFDIQQIFLEKKTDIPRIF